MRDRNYSGKNSKSTATVDHTLSPNLLGGGKVGGRTKMKKCSEKFSQAVFRCGVTENRLKSSNYLKKRSLHFVLGQRGGG